MVRSFFTSPPMPYLGLSNLSWLAPSFVGKTGEKDKSLIEVATKWLGLFQALLLAPAQHSWAKQLLQSGFPELLKSKAEWTAVMSINSKPSTSNSCSYLAVGVKEIEEVIPEQLMENSLGKKRSRKVRPNTPVVDSIVRHSNRVRVSCNVLKMNICKAKNCLGCSSDPPTLSPTSLKKIGSSLCQLQPSQLDDQILLKKKKMDPIGKRQKKGKDS